MADSSVLASAVVLAVGSIATGSFALGNAVAGDPRRAATNMHGNVIILFMTTLLRLHIVRSDYRCFRNLRRTSTLLNDGLSILERRLRRS
jgi:O-antigen ligase